MSQTLIIEVRELLEANGIVIDEAKIELFEKDVLDILDDVKYQTNNDFSEYENGYPFAISKFIAGAIEHNQRAEVKGNLKSRSMGTVSYTFNDYESTYPKHLMSLLDRFMVRRKAKFHVFK